MTDNNYYLKLIIILNNCKNIQNESNCISWGCDLLEYITCVLEINRAWLVLHKTQSLLSKLKATMATHSKKGLIVHVTMFVFLAYLILYHPNWMKNQNQLWKQWKEKMILAILFLITFTFSLARLHLLKCLGMIVL